MTTRLLRTGVLLTAAATLGLMLNGCPARPQRRPPAPPMPAPAAPPAQPAADPDLQRSQTIADAVAELEGVGNALVVVSGQEAYIGVDMDAQWARRPQANATVERRVAQAVLRGPYTIHRVYVTTKPELYQSIFSVAEGLRTGQPLDRFRAELSKIGAEIKPETLP